MATIKSFTDIPQSKVLAEFLPIESADMEYMFLKEDGNKVSNIPFVKDNDEPEWPSDSAYDFIPCWSLAALLDVLPEGIIENYYAPNLQKENGKYSIAYGNDELLCIADNPVDACVAMIEKLHEQNLL